MTHDRSVPVGETPPFLPRADGSWDFARLNLAYFDRAERMLETLVAKGFVPALALLWCSYVTAHHRAAANAGRSAIAVYCPFPVILDLAVDRAGYDCTLVDLAMRRILAPELDCGATTRMRLPPLNNDCLLLARRNVTAIR